jgi:hypothetical protein
MDRYRIIVCCLVVGFPAVARPDTDSGPDFFVALGFANLANTADSPLGPPKTSSATWMTQSELFSNSTSTAHLPDSNSFQQMLDRVSDSGTISSEIVRQWDGVYRDPGWWRYRQVQKEQLYRRTSKIELPDPFEVRTTPYSGREWKTDERMQIPVPIPIPVAEQLFVYGQVTGTGDALNNHQTTVAGKTGVGLKWSFLWKTELQLKSGATFNYADLYGPPRSQDGAKPAVEFVATLPLVGPWELEYTGAALPAMSRNDTGLVKQELRLALPLRGDGEFEFGARYRWEDTPTGTPWLDRAQLFLGVKFRH